VERIVDKARAACRARVWPLAGQDAPHVGISFTDPLVVDLDTTPVTAHSDKQHARPTFKKGYGFHPLCAFADHGQTGTGEPLEVMLRAGNAGSNTAADHITVTRSALAQLPVPASKKILVRADGADGTQKYVAWLAKRGVQYSVGFKLPDDTAGLDRRRATALGMLGNWDGAPTTEAEATQMLAAADEAAIIRCRRRLDRGCPAHTPVCSDAGGWRGCLASGTSAELPAAVRACPERRDVRSESGTRRIESPQGIRREGAIPRRDTPATRRHRPALNTTSKNGAAAGKARRVRPT